MRHLAILATAVALLLPSMARAAPSVEYDLLREHGTVHLLRFPISDTAESNAFEVRGMCAVTFVVAGSDVVELYSVPTMGTATSGGTLIGAAFSASTTSPTVFQAGTSWVRAVATTADAGGSTMRIHCSNAQISSKGEACIPDDSGLAPYVGSGGQFKCEAAYAYNETTNQLTVGEVNVDATAGSNAIRIEGNASFSGTAPTGGEVVIHSLTSDNALYMENAGIAGVPERLVTASPNYFDHIITRGIRFTDVTNQYGGAPDDGDTTVLRFCLRESAPVAVTMVDDNAVSGGDTSVFPLETGCATGSGSARPDFSQLIPGDPYIKSVWCSTSTNIAGGANVWDTLNTNIRAGAYRWIDSVAVPGEYWVELVAGGDPSISHPSSVTETLSDTPMTLGTLGSLAAGEWAYGDNDTIGFSTVYVNLTAGGDPDSQANGWVNYFDSDQIRLRFAVANAPEATDQYDVIVHDMDFSYDTLLAEHGTVERNHPLRFDVNAYASSFFSGGLSPGDLNWTHFMISIESIHRFDGWNTMQLECGYGLEFRL